MNETSNTLELSANARDQQQAMLPGLLTAVKHRRRRRQTVRAIGAVALIAVVGVALQALWSSAGSLQPQPEQPEVRASSWTTFRNDPTVTERCVVATVLRAEWFVGDDEVNDLLRGAGRASGIIRAGGRVQVNQAAFDPWPEPATDE